MLYKCGAVDAANKQIQNNHQKHGHNLLKKRPQKDTIHFPGMGDEKEVTGSIWMGLIEA